jgi:hypothetical protein
LWSGNVYACTDVNGSTVTYTSDCRQIVVTGDGSNITIDGATIKGHSSDDEDGIITTAGTNTIITINSNAGIGYDTAAGLDRYGIRHGTGSGSITTITNNGLIETKQSTTNGAGYPIYNNSTIGDIVNSGQIYSNSKVAIQNGSAGTISKIENTATGDIWSLQKYTIQNRNTIGTITNAGMIRSSKEQAIRNTTTDLSVVPTITLIENKSGATIQSDNETIHNSSGATITTIKNAGTIKAWGADGKAIRNYNATIGTIENTGTISTTKTSGGSGQAIISSTGGVINTINNSGTISAIDGNGVIYVNATGAIGTITNSGNITGDDSGAAIKNEGSITTINNSGNITDSTDADGIKNILGATIGTINNTGTITGANLDIRNANDAGASGTITTLINSQGGSDALTYGYQLPTNYKVILNSTTDYGKIVFSNKSGTTTFDVDSSSVYSGSTETTYTDVISGLTESDIVSCNSDTDCVNNNNNGVVQGSNRYYWKLDDTNGDDDWDLIVTPVSIINNTNTSVEETKDEINASMNSLKAVTDVNFAQMNTYDCDFFGDNGSCYSLGGRRSKVTNPNSTTDSLILTMGKKLSENLRYGFLYHDNMRHKTPNNLKLSDKTPLVGSLIVWNQNDDGLGFRIKYANAYQEKNAEVTRNVVGESEEGKGSTTVTAISNVVEARYVLSKNNKFNYTPYFATRYAIKKQNGYTETGINSPLTYNKIEDTGVTVLFGSRLNSKITSKLNLNCSIGLEHDIYHSVDKLKPTGISGLTSVNLDSNFKRTRPVVSLGFDYELSSKIRFSTIFQYQDLAYDSMTETNSYFNFSYAY